MVALRQTLKTAMRHGLAQIVAGSFRAPYKFNTKISYGAWFSPEEYKKLDEATRRRAKQPLRDRYKWEGEQLHDMVLFVANTGLRPDEVMGLEYRDVTVVDDDDSGETILECERRSRSALFWRRRVALGG
jgi:integrase